MGKANNVLNNYLSNKRHFADLINGTVYDGRQVIHPDKLRQISPDTYEDLENKNPQKTPKRKARYGDLAMRYENSIIRVFLEENQDTISYILPIRDMGYTVARYKQQCQNIKNLHDKANDYNNYSEKFSGLRKDDKLFPVHILWLYHGEAKWDGPRSLKDMIDFGNDEDGFSEMFQDYRPHLVCINEIEDFNPFHTELRKLLEAISLKHRKAGLKAIQDNENFKHVDEETLEAISVMINTPTLWKNREAIKNKEGSDYDMCTGMREWKEEIIEETTAKVKAETTARVKEETTENETVNHVINLIHNEGFSIERALSALGVPQDKHGYYEAKLKTMVAE